MKYNLEKLEQKLLKEFKKIHNLDFRYHKYIKNSYKEPINKKKLKF